MSMTAFFKHVDMKVNFRGRDVTHRLDTDTAAAVGLLALELICDAKQAPDQLSRLNSLEQEFRSLRRALSKPIGH